VSQRSGFSTDTRISQPQQTITTTRRCCCRECAALIKVGAPCPLCEAPITAILRVYSAATARTTRDDGLASMVTV